MKMKAFSLIGIDGDMAHHTGVAMAFNEFHKEIAELYAFIIEVKGIVPLPDFRSAHPA